MTSPGVMFYHRSAFFLRLGYRCNISDVVSCTLLLVTMPGIQNLVRVTEYLETQARNAECFALHRNIYVYNDIRTEKRQYNLTLEEVDPKNARRLNFPGICFDVITRYTTYH